MSMRESCAKALYEKATSRMSGFTALGVHDGVPEWDDVDDETKRMALEEVDAVLQSLLTPSEDMAGAGRSELEDIGFFTGGLSVVPSQVFRAMIMFALNGHQDG